MDRAEILKMAFDKARDGDDPVALAERMANFLDGVDRAPVREALKPLADTMAPAAAPAVAPAQVSYSGPPVVAVPEGVAVRMVYPANGAPPYAVPAKWHAKWTPDEVAKAAELLEGGASIRDVAISLSRSERSITEGVSRGRLKVSQSTLIRLAKQAPLLRRAVGAILTSDDAKEAAE